MHTVTFILPRTNGPANSLPLHRYMTSLLLTDFKVNVRLMDQVQDIGFEVVGNLGSVDSQHTLQLRKLVKAWMQCKRMQPSLKVLSEH